MVFRAALDAVDADTWLASTIDQFPAGACGHASELLGRYLRDTLAIECACVLKDLMNRDGSWRSGHAWLDFDGLIIDITGASLGGRQSSSRASHLSTRKGTHNFISR